MSDALSKIRKLQGDAQAAFRQAEAAGDEETMRRLEQLFEKLLRAEDKILLGNLAVSAATVADLAEELKRATREINDAVGSLFMGDAQQAGRELEVLSREIHSEIRHQPAPEGQGEAPESDAEARRVTSLADVDLDLPPRTPASYAEAFAAQSIRLEWKDDADAIVDTFFTESKNRRYREVERTTGVPWWVIAILHSLESSQNFGTHLHNGDPLSAPTVHEPKNRPANWRPGMSWEESAADAITQGNHQLHRIGGWSVGHALEVFERYNGLGYRKRGLMSPYLWSGSEFYEKGKFVADSQFDAEAVSRQVGAAVLLQQLSERGEISISAARNTVTPRAPAILGSIAVAESNLQFLSHAKDELDFPGNANSAIKAGTEGMKVQRIQEWCCHHGRSTGIDSGFGESTRRAVELFQRDQNLPPTGDVDRDTWLLLTAPMRRALAAAAPQNSLNATLLKVAGQHIDQRPKEVGGNNCGPWVRLYMSGNDGADQLWCAGFVCTLLAQTARDMGIATPLKRQVGVDALVADAKREGRFVAETSLSIPSLRSSKIPPGSLFVVRKSARDWTHVGIVTRMEENLFSTMEGNTNGQDNDGGNAKRSTRSIAKKDFVLLA